MAKYIGTNCRNFRSKGNGTIVDGRKWVTECGCPNCADRPDCDGEQIVQIAEVHFEPISPPPGPDEIIHTL